MQRSQEKNKVMDTEPADLDRKAFLLRQRVPEMELGADRMRLKP